MKLKRLLPRKFPIILFCAVLIAALTIIYQNKDNLNNFLRPYFINDPILNPYNADKKQQIIRLLSQYDIYAIKIKSLSDSMEVTLNNGTQIFFPKEFLENKVASLQLILKRFTIEGRKVKVIDLRYSKPVIK